MLIQAQILDITNVVNNVFTTRAFLVLALIFCRLVIIFGASFSDRTEGSFYPLSRRNNRKDDIRSELKC